MSTTGNVVFAKCPKTKGGVGKFIRSTSHENTRE
jgi:hypothetical protein